MYSPISVPMWSPSFTEISQWRDSSQHWRAMSSFSWNGASSSSKSKQVRPAPSSAWISPTKMPCISERERSAGGRAVAAILAGPVLRSAILAPRGSKMRSSILVRTKRSSRASSDSGEHLLHPTAYLLARSASPRLPGPAMPPDARYELLELVPGGAPPARPSRASRSATGAASRRRASPRTRPAG